MSLWRDAQFFLVYSLTHRLILNMKQLATLEHTNDDINSDGHTCI